MIPFPKLRLCKNNQLVPISSHRWHSDGVYNILTRGSICKTSPIRLGLLILGLVMLNLFSKHEQTCPVNLPSVTMTHERRSNFHCYCHMKSLNIPLATSSVTWQTCWNVHQSQGVYGRNLGTYTMECWFTLMTQVGWIKFFSLNSVLNYLRSCEQAPKRWQNKHYTNLFWIFWRKLTML